METPEYIAKFYGGDTNKILQALQSGALKAFAPAPFDETLAAAAADYAQRTRAAAQAQQAPQQTVFQKLFSPAQPQLPMGAPAGLGATPQAAAMPPMDAAPQMGMPPQEMALPQEMAPPQDMGALPPQEMPMMAEGGMVPPYMAGGGLSDVPLPDGMFDEPSNGGFGDGYAGGGMVAFAPGGNIDAARLRRALREQESRGDYGVMNAEGSGAMGAYQFMPPTAKALAKRLGLEYRPDLLQGKKGRSKEGIDYQERLMDAQMEDILAYSGGDIGKAGAYHFAGPNKKGHGAKTRKYEQDILRRYSGSKDTGDNELAGAARGANTLYGMPTDLQGNIDLFTSLMPEESAEQLEYRKELEEGLSPENRAQDKKDAFYGGLAKFAARLGSSKNPSFLGGLAETLGAGAGDIAESLEADKARIREMQRERTALSNATRKEKIEALQMGVNLNVKAADLAENIEDRKQDAKFKEAALAIQSAQLNAELLKIAAESQDKQNTKEQFIQTFYDQFTEKGYSPTLARQYAYISAEMALEKIKGSGEGLFGGAETGGVTSQKSVNTLDYGSLKD